MKLFKELKKGDDLFIVKSDKMKITWGTAKIVLAKLEKSLGEVTVLFTDGGTRSVVVDADSSSHSVKYGISPKEIWYFADKYAVEVFFKEKCEELKEMIKDLESSYMKLWEDNSEADSEDDTDSLSVKGKILHVEPFKYPGICDGSGKIYFHDGGSLSLTIFKDTDVREATEEEKSLFFEKCRDKMIHDKKEIRDQLSKALSSCGYAFNLLKRAFYKIEYEKV